MTKGKIIATVLSVIFLSNAFLYIVTKGNPFNTPFDKADGRTTITGISIGWVGMMLAGALIFYIFDKWDEKL